MQSIRLRKHVVSMLAFSLMSVCLASASVVAETFPAVKIESLISELNQPWGLVQLPDSGWLITEKNGSIVWLDVDGNLQRTGSLPDGLYTAGQGGALDIALHPNFAENRWVYLSYASGDANANRLSIARASFKAGKFSDWQPIFDAMPDKDTPVHYAGRLVLTEDALWVTSGDGFDYREQAQVVDSMLGKVLRMDDNGNPLASNPFYTSGGAPQDFVYTLGHRNPQGLVYDAKTQQLWLNEHGPAGGDEINLLDAGDNYGWPVVTLGKDYSGANISPFESYQGMRDPVVNWTPSIAPSSMVIYRGDMFPTLAGDFLVTALKTQRLHWVRIRDGEVLVDKPVVESLKQRLRDIEVGQDGALYILTNGENASLLRMSAE